MGVGGQHHAPAALPPGKRRKRLCTQRKGGWGGARHADAVSVTLSPYCLAAAASRVVSAIPDIQTASAVGPAACVQNFKSNFAETSPAVSDIKPTEERTDGRTDGHFLQGTRVSS